MASFIPNPDEVNAALKPYLEPGEQIKHAAYGVHQSKLLMIAALFLTASLASLLTWKLTGSFSLLSQLIFFLLWLGMFGLVTTKIRKDYVIGLTDLRLLLVRIKTPIFKHDLKNTVSHMAYLLDQLTGVETSIGRLTVIIKLKNARPALKLQFGRLAMGSNRGTALADGAVGLANALTDRYRSQA